VGKLGRWWENGWP